MVDIYLEAVVDSKPQKIPLAPGAICNIGRGEQSTVMLVDNQVSRKHAMIQRMADGRCYLFDLGSRNGTLVNQRRVTAPAELQNGDRITIGASEFVFHAPSKCGAVATTASGETVLEFSQRLITILVTDIRDFTGLSRRLGEEKLSQLMNAFNRECGAGLTAHGAWAQKFLGDAVMAIWVHQLSTPAVAEMLGVAEALDQVFGIAARLQGQFNLEEPVRIGAGINTGLACIGNMGSDASADYTALSDSVNLTFRLESATKDVGCDLAVGRRTHEFLAGEGLAGDLFIEHLVPLKGYQEPKPLYAASRESVTILADRLRARGGNGAG